MSGPEGALFSGVVADRKAVALGEGSGAEG